MWGQCRCPLHFSPPAASRWCRFGSVFLRTLLTCCCLRSIRRQHLLHLDRDRSTFSLRLVARLASAGLFSKSYPAYPWVYSCSRYHDKLMLAAGWLYRATGACHCKPCCPAYCRLQFAFSLPGQACTSCCKGCGHALDSHK